MPLYMVEKEVGDVTVLDLRGRITLGPETVALRERLKRLVESGHSRVVLSFQYVDYVDTVGLSTLVASYASARKHGGDLRLAHLTTRLRGLLQITRLITVFESFDSVEGAIGSFDREPSG